MPPKTLLVRKLTCPGYRKIRTTNLQVCLCKDTLDTDLGCSGPNPEQFGAAGCSNSSHNQDMQETRRLHAKTAKSNCCSLQHAARKVTATTSPCRPYNFSDIPFFSFVVMPPLLHPFNGSRIRKRGEGMSQRMQGRLVAWVSIYSFQVHVHVCTHPQMLMLKCMCSQPQHHDQDAL